MYICYSNRDREAHAECSVRIHDDRVRFVGRDDGRELDLTDEDMKMESLRGYVLSRLTSQELSASKHLLAMSFNRN
ncbi:MAG: hypothetical protein IJU51_08225, partial [Clostridia bacterium]|nr:hypothetical protein [Clostridia bacterium]